MSDMHCSILCVPDVEEKLLDALLVNFPDAVFTSIPTFDHGVAHDVLTPGDQVRGGARSLLVQILLNADEWATLKDLLTRDFAGTRVRYWVTMIAEEGACR